jgi:hypothetical protein
MVAFPATTAPADMMAPWWSGSLCKLNPFGDFIVEIGGVHSACSVPEVMALLPKTLKEALVICILTNIICHKVTSQHFRIPVLQKYPFQNKHQLSDLTSNLYKPTSRHGCNCKSGFLSLQSNQKLHVCLHTFYCKYFTCVLCTSCLT